MPHHVVIIRASDFLQKTNPGCRQNRHQSVSRPSGAPQTGFQQLPPQASYQHQNSQVLAEAPLHQAEAEEQTFGRGTLGTPGGRPAD